MPYQPTYPRHRYTVRRSTFYSDMERRAPPEYETIEINELAPVDTQPSRPTTQASRGGPPDLQARQRRTGRNALPEPATQPRRWLPAFRGSEREYGTETLEDARWEIRLYIIVIYFLLIFIVIMNILYNVLYNVYYGRALRRCQS
ncbi:hypothetical protein ASPCAL05928 [Aspergillus calidoustus]|uniref:Uncharacterized protein n=1 Tax=Aspergillus calidoustus TaxID=454130 RepID=A0A0U5FZP2_ASPCI|nr:hypothetical protein ASPCAL05928 [Aspergillus calidoustus]